MESNLCTVSLLKTIAFIVKVIDKDFNTVTFFKKENSFGALMKETDVSFICHYHFMREITFI